MVNVARIEPHRVEIAQRIARLLMIPVTIRADGNVLADAPWGASRLSSMMRDFDLEKMPMFESPAQPGPSLYQSAMQNVVGFDGMGRDAKADLCRSNIALMFGEKPPTVATLAACVLGAFALSSVYHVNSPNESVLKISTDDTLGQAIISFHEHRGERTVMAVWYGHESDQCASLIIRGAYRIARLYGFSRITLESDALKYAGVLGLDANTDGERFWIYESFRQFIRESGNPDLAKCDALANRAAPIWQFGGTDEWKRYAESKRAHKCLLSVNLCDDGMAASVFCAAMSKITMVESGGYATPDLSMIVNTHRGLPMYRRDGDKFILSQAE